ncbi:MAG: hypothetical protein KDC44_04220, partial [Phaeodactylibacter sp.]|nr:hypothetical protein [Phaeodactylibacter sp.]
MPNLRRWLECRFRQWLPNAEPPHKVHRQTWNFHSQTLDQTVRVDLYLPAVFFSVDAADLPVLYINDGQDMEAVQLQKTLEQLYSTEQLPPIIVAAF